MDAVEERIAATSSETVEESMYVDDSLAELAADLAPARSYGGPTIREFLSGLVARVPGSVAGATPAESPIGVSDEIGLDEHVERPIDDFAGAAEVAAQAESSEPTDGSLDTLFSDAGATATDLAAADTLAQAFASETPGDPSQPIIPVEAHEPMAPAAGKNTPFEGQPAHRAVDELSLDHVFKTNSVPRAALDNGGFSFDQFFSDEVVEGAAETSPESAAAAQQGADDIAQFNAWLNGLKKS
jgi:hypothetical protein